jgi:hypothetical protein
MKSGVAASALRYCERKGLIRSLESQGLGASSRRRCWISWRSSRRSEQPASRWTRSGRCSPQGEPNIDRAMLSAKADELERSRPAYVVVVLPEGAQAHSTG